MWILTLDFHINLQRRVSTGHQRRRVDTETGTGATERETEADNPTRALRRSPGVIRMTQRNETVKCYSQFVVML